MDPQVRPFVLSLERLHNDIFKAVEPLSSLMYLSAPPSMSTWTVSTQDSSSPQSQAAR